MFYQQAARYGKNVLAADLFCDTYLSCYLMQLLRQIATGKSTEADADKVVVEMARVCARHRIFERFQINENWSAVRWPGLLHLWTILHDKNAVMVPHLPGRKPAQPEQSKTKLKNRSNINEYSTKSYR